MNHVKGLVESTVGQGFNGWYCTNCGSSEELEDLYWDIQDKPRCPYCGDEGYVDLHKYWTGDGTKPFEVGETVYWHDPDDDTCSRIVTIETIYGQADHLVIVGTDGSELHCPHSELEALIECPQCNQTFSCNDGSEETCIADHGHCHDCHVAWQHGEGSNE